MSKSSTAVSGGLEGSHWVRQGRAPIACQQCRIQRVRCDVVLQQGSCTNCAHYGVECQIVSGKRQARALGNSFTAPARDVYIGSREGLVEPHGKSTEAPKTVSPLTERPAHISEEDFVLLRNRATFELPNYELRYQMIQGYLHNLFGYLPIIGFQDLVTMAEPGRLYSNWFVFMAMAAISVHFIDRCRLGELGARSVHSASEMFFKKAETLYRFQWKGPHKYCTLQGLLLLAFCEKELYGKDGWTWTWAAYTDAIQMGLDRPTPKSISRQSGLRRRLWWTCYSQCCLLTVHTSTHSRIRIAESEAPLPKETDFEQQNPSFCPGLTAAFAVAQGSHGHFIHRVELLHVYNMCTLRQQTSLGRQNAVPGILTNIRDIFKSALETNITQVVGLESAVPCNIPYSPLDTSSGDPGRSHDSGQLDMDMIDTILDMERVLYNCGPTAFTTLSKNE